MRSIRTISKSTSPATFKPTRANMPCYIATPRHSYHSGFGPAFGRRTVSPFADVTASLQPLFRLLDEELTSAATSRPIRNYQPRFDVREEQDAYHLQGELPGINSQNVTIEFKDEKTLVISGRTARESQSKDPNSSATAATEAAADAASETASQYKSPTVEEDEFVDVGEGEQTQPTESKNKEVEKPAAKTEVSQSEPQHKYWVSERSVGEFRRSFTFPGHVNQEAVTASLKDGILNVTVPKVAPKEPRRINIE